MVAEIPDDAGVTINRNWNVDIVSVSVESADPFGNIHADLQLTSGFSLTKDEILASMFRHKMSSTPDAETR